MLIHPRHHTHPTIIGTIRVTTTTCTTIINSTITVTSIVLIDVMIVSNIIQDCSKYWVQGLFSRSHDEGTTGRNEGQNAVAKASGLIHDKARLVDTANRLKVLVDCDYSYD